MKIEVQVTSAYLAGQDAIYAMGVCIPMREIVCYPRNALHEWIDVLSSRPTTFGIELHDSFPVSVESDTISIFGIPKPKLEVLRILQTPSNGWEISLTPAYWVQYLLQQYEVETGEKVLLEKIRFPQEYSPAELHNVISAYVDQALAKAKGH